MDISQVGAKLREQIHAFSGELSPRFTKPVQRFIEQMVYGIVVSKDVKLSQISRALEEPIALKKTEDRLSINLGREHLAEELMEEVARAGKRRIREETLLIIDVSEISKSHARKMEYLEKVRDGSTGEIRDGYWTINVIASTVGGKGMVPLYQSLHSSAAPGFKGENEEILKAIEVVSRESGDKGIWVGDRGTDRRKLYNPLLGNKKRFIIRLVGDRNLVFRGRLRTAEDIARGCPLSYAETIVKEGKDGEKSSHLAYGYRKVRLPGRREQLWMVVIRGFGREPLMLLTAIPLRKKRRLLWFIVEAYLTRWRIEEAIRFTKQSYNLEDVRVLTYRRLRNLIALVLVAGYFSVAYLGERLKLAILANRVMKAAKRFYGIAAFRYYAIADGIAYILRRLGKGPLCVRAVVEDTRQLTFASLL